MCLCLCLSVLSYKLVPPPPPARPWGLEPCPGPSLRTQPGFLVEVTWALVWVKVTGLGGRGRWDGWMLSLRGLQAPCPPAYASEVSTSLPRLGVICLLRCSLWGSPPEEVITVSLPVFFHLIPLNPYSQKCSKEGLRAEDSQSHTASKGYKQAIDLCPPRAEHQVCLGGTDKLGGQGRNLFVSPSLSLSCLGLQPAPYPARAWALPSASTG